MGLIKKIFGTALVSLLIGTTSSGMIMTKKKVKEVIQETPQYFQEHLGEVKIEPLNPLFWISCGSVSGITDFDKDARVHLSPFATEYDLRHELGHSFDFRQKFNNPGYYNEFYLRFYNGDKDGGRKYPGLPLKLALVLHPLFIPPPVKEVPFPAPISRIPIPGYPSVFAFSDHDEAVAEFIAVTLEGGAERRWDKFYSWRLDCIERYICGAYGKPTTNAGTFLKNRFPAPKTELKTSPLSGMVYVRRLMGGDYAVPEDAVPGTVRSAVNYLLKNHRPSENSRTAASVFEKLMDPSGNFAQESSQTYLRRLFGGIYSPKNVSESLEEVIN